MAKINCKINIDSFCTRNLGGVKEGGETIEGREQRGERKKREREGVRKERG